MLCWPWEPGILTPRVLTPRILTPRILTPSLEEVLDEKLRSPLNSAQLLGEQHGRWVQPTLLSPLSRGLHLPFGSVPLHPPLETDQMNLRRRESRAWAAHLQ